MINNKKVKALENRVKELEEHLKAIQDRELYDQEQDAIKRISRPTIDLGTHNLRLTEACGKLRIECEEKPKDDEWRYQTFSVHSMVIEKAELPWKAIVELKKILNEEIIG